MSNATSTVYECFNPAACVGTARAGSNMTQRRRLDSGDGTSMAGDDTSMASDIYCAPGHTGFLCAACMDNW